MPLWQNVGKYTKNLARIYTNDEIKDANIVTMTRGLILLFSFKGSHFMLFYANSLFIRFFFVSLQPKDARTGYASAIQVYLIALGLHRPCPREQKDYDYDSNRVTCGIVP